MNVKEQKPTSFKKQKEYLIHDNGGRPFKVIIDNKLVKVYKINSSKSTYDNLIHDKLIKTIPYIGVFIGKHNGADTYTGNSILVHIPPLSQNKYICIGYSIIEFNTLEPIVTFTGLIGNSDVPCPYASTKSFIYMMLEAPSKKGEKNTYWYINKKFSANKDPYIQFYDLYPFKTNKTHPFLKFKAKTIVKRLLNYK